MTAPETAQPIQPIHHYKKIDSTRKRFWWGFGTFVVSFLIALAGALLLPVLGLATAVSEDHPNSILKSDPDVQIQQVTYLVFNSTALWYLAIGGVLGLISTICGVVDSKNQWTLFWSSKLVSVGSATFVAAAGVLAVYPLLT